MNINRFLETRCPFCSSTFPTVLREGARSTKSGRVQRYYCKSCERYFSERNFPGTKHPPRVIFAAITFYNQGYTLDGTAKQLKQRHKVTISQSTIHSWVRRYSDVCSFSKLRHRYKLDPEKTILAKRFEHDQVYNYKLHTLKANLMGKGHPSLKGYLFNILRSFDSSPFSSGNRCSETVIFNRISAKKLSTSTAPLLCKMGLETARRTRERHDKVEHFFLINDLATVAVEIPVFATGREIKKILPGWNRGNLHGHIDMLQYRAGRIVVMDYKPVPPDVLKTQNQLSLYAMLLSIRTGVSLETLKCGYFNKEEHREFYPTRLLFQ